MSKFIFVTGGVVSSLGKGLTAASLGLILRSRGLSIKVQKLDPYINVDAGTMNPFQHGEVYVTDDGAETDLDLGHYERFTGITATQESNYTTGRIYKDVIEKERAGDHYLGATVQVVPHITNAIKDAFISLEDDDTDIIMVELGGTVGDIEGLPFIEALRQFGLERPSGDVMYIHLTLVPYLRASGEMKTKPTQHSVQKLREFGIQPDMLICRTEHNINEEMRQKIAMFCSMRPSHVIEEKDVDTSIYEVPVLLRDQGVDKLVTDFLGIEAPKAKMQEWEDMVKTVCNTTESVDIAVIGKYTSLTDSYKSIYESLAHGGIANGISVNIRKIESAELTQGNIDEMLKGVSGVLVPGGFGVRGIEGKMESIRWARENNIPFFGICYGMQCAVVEYAKNVCGQKNATSAEWLEEGSEGKLSDCVIALMDEQHKVTAKGGTMRLGAYECDIKTDTLALSAYSSNSVNERHRHRYEVNPEVVSLLEENGMTISGVNPKNNLVEIIELKNHPWFLATQAHPEFKSRPVAAHPLFKSFVSATLAYQKEAK